MNSRFYNRRTFLKQATCGLFLSGASAGLHAGQAEWKKANYFVLREGNLVQCTLCPWQCVIAPGTRGHCGVRLNRNGTLYSLVYGQIAANHVDPIEKKPFYHFLPGELAYSIATAGCNLDCKFCQNWELAQRKPEEIYSLPQTPEQIVAETARSKANVIAYTYNEPTVFAEYMADIACIAREKGIKNVVVSSGYINKKPLEDLCRYIDAYKIDLKSFSDLYYRKVVNGKLQPVLDTLLRLKDMHVWTEIVYLVVPTLNDNSDEVGQMCQWVVNNLGPDVPLHFSKFYPQYKLRNLPPTPVSTLEACYQIALDSGLNYVYLGNIPGDPGENTKCPSCHQLLIQRKGYRVYKNHIQNGTCPYCQTQIPGVWKT